MPTRTLIALAVIGAASAGGYALWSMTNPGTVLVQGEVDATRIDLASRVSGRITAIPVDFGDRVMSGQTVVELDSPQLRASLETAQAALSVAEANRVLANSTRPETIAAREAELEKTNDDVNFAQQTYDRIQRLQETAVASAQTHDEASNRLSAAIRAREAAAANLELARNGQSAEERNVARAQEDQARASVEQTQTDISELVVLSPIDGQVTARMAELGRNFTAGSPLISIVDIDNSWFTFNLREDLLAGLQVGDELEVRVPALEDKVFTAKISAINVLGTFANWRATRATGDFDLRTFSVRAEPTERDTLLRPGMSALVDFGTR